MDLWIFSILNAVNVNGQDEFLYSLLEADKSQRKFSSGISLNDIIPFEMMSTLLKMLPDNQVDISLRYLQKLTDFF